MQVGRNSPCPCGSGKKYKRCCLASGEFEQVSSTGVSEEQALATARSALSLNDLTRAHKALAQLLEAAQPSEATLDLAYHVAMRERDYARAGEPRNASHRANYATTLALSGKLAAAAEAFEAALAIAPQLWSAYPNYANTLRDLGRSREAARGHEGRGRAEERGQAAAHLVRGGRRVGGHWGAVGVLSEVVAVSEIKCLLVSAKADFSSA